MALRWHGSGAQTQTTTAAVLAGVSAADCVLSAAIQADPGNDANLHLTDNDDKIMAVIVPGATYSLGDANPSSDCFDITELKLDAVSGTQTYYVAWRS